jgi:amidase
MMCVDTACEESTRMSTDIGPYSRAIDMLAALRERRVSSQELVDMHLARIEAHDREINAIPVRTPDRARAAARRADAAIASGDARALLGLPTTLKESTQTAGLPQTAGLEPFRDYKPATDGPLAARVFEAGACLLGKTNIPAGLADWQADSPIYGRTKNPWDLTRTPGGSTGGGGAALAAGLTPLEVGSDIGGSIRVPAAYCGVYGHRPSETAIAKAGVFPLADLPNPAALMGVQGPLARSAFDLELLFDVLAGPVVGEDRAWRLDLPPPRQRRLRDFRVAVMPAPAWVKPARDMQDKVDELARFLGRVGAKVSVAMPAVDPEAYFRDYLTLLNVMMSQGRPRAEREAAARERRRAGDFVARAEADGMVLDAGDYLMLVNRREAARAAWRAFFEDYDVLVGPMALDAAFPHQSGEFSARRLQIDNESVPYEMNLTYPMWAIFAGQPSTAFPAGKNRAGLPLGLQAIGPYLEDRTTLAFAQCLEREWHAFERPPGY